MKLIRFALVAVVVAAAPGCRRGEVPEPGLATPSVKISHDKVPLGSPIDITYTFVVAPDAPPFKEAYRVFAGVVDADEQLMWTDDHNPPTPTTEWKPNETITYTRTVFVPIYPYVGEATIHMGLSSPTTQKRLPLNGDSVGAHAYRVAKLQLQPQTENVFTVFRDGWHPAEVADQNQFVEWQWTKKAATLAFKNPRKNAIFYLDLDNPGGVFNDSQQVQVKLGTQMLDQFTLTPKQPTLRKIALSAAQLGTEDLVELHITVDKTFVPALLSATRTGDPRELGVRVFHAFIQPIN
jgi:hypothetical protein